MRPKRLARLAALVVAGVVVTGVVGCNPDNINNNVNINNNPRPGILIGSKTDTIGSCFRTLDIKSMLAAGFTNMNPGEQREGFVDEHFVGSGCPARQSYNWSSKDVAVVTAMRVDSTTGRVTAIAPVATSVCATGTRDGAQVCAPASVNGATTQPTISTNPTSISGNRGANCPETSQTFAVVVTGLTNPTIANLVSSDPAVAMVTASGLTVTVRIMGSGAAHITGSIAGHPELTFSVPVSVTANACSGNVCAVTGMTATVTSSAINVGQSANFTVTQVTNGVAGCPPLTVTVSGPLTVSNMVVNGNVVTGTVTGTGQGTGTILGVSADGTHSAQATVVVSAVAGSISVAVTPATFSLIVGGQPVTLTCTVSGAQAGQSTACTWATAQGTCVSLSPQGGNQVIVTAIAGCVGQVTVTATSVADVTKSGSSVGTTSSGNVQCVINWNGTTSGTITVAVNQTTPVTASCTNQFGAQFVPYWRSSDASRADVVGTTAVYPIGGVNYPAGAQASIKGIFAGTATITAQAAITDATVLAQRVVVVQ